MADVSLPRPQARLAARVATAVARVGKLVAIVLAATLLASIGVVPFVVKAGAAVQRVSNKLGDVPPMPALKPGGTRSVIYAADGSVLDVLVGDQDRILTRLRDVPKVAQHAVVAMEDDRFYEHRGLDYHGIVRAAVADLKGGQLRQGGSTLTQQLIKNTVTGNSRTLDRKVREAIYAVQLEKRMTKDQILEAYLNQAYFGEGVYGIATAAEHYFSEPVGKLNLLQSAALAATIAAPSAYNPTHAKLNAQRRAIVLDRMAQLGYASRQRVNAAKRAKLILRIHNHKATEPYYAAYVRYQLLHDHAYDDTLGPVNSKQRYDAIFEGGLKIYTTLQPRNQQQAQAAVHDQLDPADPSLPDGALTSVDPTTGRIIAMVSGKDFHRSNVNLAIRVTPEAPIGSQGAQPGSSFKVFYLVAALEQHLPLNLTFDAPPTLKVAPRSECPEGWEVHNAEEREGGVFDLYTGTWKSVNTYFAQLMEQVGPAAALEAARRMGVDVPPVGRRDSTNPNWDYYHWDTCSSVLGTMNVSTLELASAFGVLANKGVLCEPFTIAKVVAPGGRVLLDRKPSCRQVIDPGVAAQADDILQGVVQHGTGTRADLGRPLAGKTGTTDDFQAAWFTGFTPQLATSVWVGYTPTPRPMRGQFQGGHVYGGTFPALIFHQYMQAALESSPVLGFPPPPQHRPADSGATSTPVPDVVGLQVGQASSILRQAGYAVATRTVAGDQPKGTVVDQSPAAGTDTPQGAAVTLGVSSGQGTGSALVPGVVGLPVGQARATLAGAGFRIVAVPVPGRGQRGRVLSQAPGGGSQAPPGATVLLLVGR